jgi:predicted choloylglycine hydrolase
MSVEDWRIDNTKIHSFAGNYFNMGKQQGEQFKKNLIHGFEIIKNHEGINNLRPKFVPKPLFFKIAQSKAYDAFSHIFEKFAPNQAERIHGISEGSGISEKMIYLLCSTEAVLGNIDYEIPIQSGCSDIGYKQSKNERNHSMVSRNFDFERMVLDFLCNRKNAPLGKLKSWDITASPLPGTFNGVNEKGLFIGTDEAFPTSEHDIGLPASVIIQETLENCSNSDDAFEFIKNLPRGSCNIYLISDRNANMFACEYTSKRIFKRLPPANKNYLVATNHYLTPELAKIDIPQNAVFTKKNARALWGGRVNETSWKRLETATRILDSKKVFKIEDMKALHRDHSSDPANKGNFDTICHHDPVNVSAASMIYDLETMEAWLCFGSPCEKEYIHFNLND